MDDKFQKMLNEISLEVARRSAADMSAAVSKWSGDPLGMMLAAELITQKNRQQRIALGRLSDYLAGIEAYV